MSKWKNCYDGARKYLPEWEREFPWLQEDESKGAYCKLCKCSLRAKKSILSKHSGTASHMQIEKRCNAKKKVTSFIIIGENLELKKTELQLAASICCHCSISSIDHLSEVVKKNSKGSIMEKLKLHRTKCSKLITEVIAPSIEKELIDELKDKKYSIIMDETTDITSEKKVCVSALYYNDANESIVSNFLGLASVTETTGEVLFNSLSSMLLRFNLQFKSCIGFGTDGAKNMTGKNNSVWSRILNESPNCLKMQCICHSLALCVKKAFEILPSHLGFLLTEIPSWFKKSTERREKFKMLTETINLDEDVVGNPLPFKKTSCTRWLVRGTVIYNILVNWLELKTYFQQESRCATQKARYKARMIFDIINDDINQLYFIFLCPIIQEFEKVNALFQSQNVEPENLVKELNIHYQSLERRLYSHEGNLLQIHEVDFGAHFSHELMKYKQHNSNADAVNNLLKRCHEFLLELLKEVKERLPENKEVFKKMSWLKPSKVLNQVDRISFKELPLPHLMDDPQAVESQYRKIILHEWKEEEIFKDFFPAENTVLFWSKIKKYTNGTGNQPYRELADYALNCLSLPISNAEVERIFSQLSLIKNKVRNNLSLKMLDSIIRIRTYFQSKGICCNAFQPSTDMLNSFNSNMYDNNLIPTDDDKYLDLL